MKIIRSKKFGRRLVLTLEKELPEDFRNHSRVSVDGHVFYDALVAMTSGKNQRTDLSVKFDGYSNVEGKDLVLV